MPFALKALILFVVGIVAGVVNSVAGGGTLLSFPTLIFTGVPAIIANATNTIALQAGTIASFVSYRREFASQKKLAWLLAPPSLIGGLVGAVLLLNTSEAYFRHIIPYLILFATVLFTFQPFVSRLLQLEAQAAAKSKHARMATAFFVFCVGIYGGYFGAGIGILMLAALGLIVHGDIHEMNSLKVLLSSLMNGIAAIYFIANGSVLWPDAIVLAAGALGGGYTGPILARRVGPKAVRAFVTFVGFAIGLYFLVQR
ncbi:MAG: sulfite exporter TauE/SafE family protein [Acidobacteria bacterium]|nr:sulfite exporter TauE/SafE family protein [Acidobacteriota bacterium]